MCCFNSKDVGFTETVDKAKGEISDSPVSARSGSRTRMMIWVAVIKNSSRNPSRSTLINRLQHLLYLRKISRPGTNLFFEHVRPIEWNEDHGGF